jgi:hypothetical protein
MQNFGNKNFGIHSSGILRRWKYNIKMNFWKTGKKLKGENK